MVGLQMRSPCGGGGVGVTRDIRSARRRRRRGRAAPGARSRAAVSRKSGALVSRSKASASITVTRPPPFAGNATSQRAPVLLATHNSVAAPSCTASASIGAGLRNLGCDQRLARQAREAGEDVEGRVDRRSRRARRTRAGRNRSAAGCGRRDRSARRARSPRRRRARSSAT